MPNRSVYRRRVHVWFDEISGADSVLVRGHDSRRGSLLFAETQTRRETRFQHVALAKISRGNPGERAVSKTSAQLAFAFATALVDSRDSRVEPTVFRR